MSTPQKLQLFLPPSTAGPATLTLLEESDLSPGPPLSARVRYLQAVDCKCLYYVKIHIVIKCHKIISLNVLLFIQTVF